MKYGTVVNYHRIFDIAASCGPQQDLTIRERGGQLPNCDHVLCSPSSNHRETTTSQLFAAGLTGFLKSATDIKY